MSNDVNTTPHIKAVISKTVILKLLPYKPNYSYPKGPPPNRSTPPATKFPLNYSTKFPSPTAAVACPQPTNSSMFLTPHHDHADDTRPPPHQVYTPLRYHSSSQQQPQLLRPTLAMSTISHLSGLSADSAPHGSSAGTPTFRPPVIKEPTLNNPNTTEVFLDGWIRPDLTPFPDETISVVLHNGLSDGVYQIPTAKVFLSTPTIQLFTRGSSIPPLSTNYGGHVGYCLVSFRVTLPDHVLNWPVSLVTYERSNVCFLTYPTQANKDTPVFKTSSVESYLICDPLMDRRVALRIATHYFNYVAENLGISPTDYHIAPGPPGPPNTPSNIFC